MNNKSYVSVVQKTCIVTGKLYDSGEILMDRRLQSSLDPTTVVGYGISPEIQEQIDKGYVVLIEADPEKSSGNTPDKVWRTGRYAFMKSDVAKKVFDMPIDTVAYIKIEAYEEIMDLQKRSEEEE